MRLRLKELENPTPATDAGVGVRCYFLRPDFHILKVLSFLLMHVLSDSIISLARWDQLELPAVELDDQVGVTFYIEFFAALCHLLPVE